MENKLFDLKDRYFLVTGASGLLGREHCEAILSSNGNPIALDINLSSLELLKKDLSKKYQKNIITFQSSVTNLKELLKVKSELHKKNIYLSGLINNAALNPQVSQNGLSSLNRLEDYCLDSWDNELEVGLKGSFLVIRTFMDDLNSHEYSGSIINISSDLGIIAPDQRLYQIDNQKNNFKQPVKPITYSVIKSGLIGMTKYMATYFDGKVRCNALCPGGILNGQNKIFLERVSKLIPMGRLAHKEEYRGSIIFLLSDASSYMNGSIISIDGGRTVW